MSADPNHSGLCFDQPDRFQHPFWWVGVVEPLLQVWKKPGRPLDCDQLIKRQARQFELVRYLVRVVKVSRREQYRMSVRISRLARLGIGFDRGNRARAVDETQPQPIQQ